MRCLMSRVLISNVYKSIIVMNSLDTSFSRPFKKLSVRVCRVVTSSLNITESKIFIQESFVDSMTYDHKLIVVYKPLNEFIRCYKNNFKIAFPEIL